MKTNLSLADVLAVLFIAFKLSHIINWSWWWVTAPLWIPVTLRAIIGFIKGYRKTPEDRVREQLDAILAARGR